MSLSLSAFLSRPEAAPLIIAHRGDWFSHPENSIPSILSAAQRGADMVEIDVQTSSDGHLILCHDKVLDRTTNGSGPVAAQTLEALTSLRLRDGYGGPDAGLSDEHLPTLGDALDAARDRVFLNIDTKTQEDLDQVCAEVLARDMGDQVLVKGPVDQPSDMDRFLNAPWYGKVAFMPVMLTIPDGALVETVLDTVRAMDLKLVELTFTDEGEIQELAKHMDAANVWMWANSLDPVHSMHYADKAALDDPDAIWGKLLDLGIRAIQTDQTEALANYRAKRLTVVPDRVAL